MRRKSFEDMNCSVAQSLEIVGEWWSMLIIRDALVGFSRFDDFQERLGISRNVLTQRLESLVEHGVLERVAYQQAPVRYDYRLTDKGRDLWPVINAIREWGDRWHAPSGAPIELVHRRCGERITARQTCSGCGEELHYFDLSVERGPGAAKSGARRKKAVP
jgi:DNA-binding HxlR family transcriptional regulator